MATLLVAGCEAIAPGNGVMSIDNPAAGTVTGTVTRDTSKQRSGRGCYKCDSGAGNAAASLTSWSSGFSSGANKVLYIRAYFCFDQLPSSTVKIVESPSVASVRLTSGGKLQLFNDNSNTQVGSDSAATIAADGATYYRVELALTLNAGATQTAAMELRLDGTTVASTTGLTIATIPGGISYGWIAAPGASKVLYIDDLKNNDSTGAANNTWPGNGKIILMFPISDNARGAWTGGAGGTTSLFDAVNNIPLGGVAEASATNTSQIKNRTTTNPTNCDLNLDSYTGAGLVAGDTVNYVELWANHGEDPATGTKAGTVTIVSNPAGSAGGSFNYGDDAGLQGTYIGNWRWTNSLASTSKVDGPSVTLGTAVVVRITCTSGATGSRSASCDFLGMIVEYTPLVQPFILKQSGTIFQDPAVFAEKRNWLWLPRLWRPRMWLPGDPLPA